MLRIRVTDARMMALQRQGRIGFYGEAMGQEAAVVGSAAASQPQDWIVPALREAGVGLYRGMSLDSYIAQIFGNAQEKVAHTFVNSSMKAPLMAYRMDMGDYPSSAEGLQALVAAPPTLCPTATVTPGGAVCR